MLLKKEPGNQLKNILEKLTSNRFKGFLLGAGVTAIIQSSSATTVMVVGFVNSGIMSLKPGNRNYYGGKRWNNHYILDS